MTDEELRIRDDLATLARSDRGRDLLQLSLRGIGESDRGLTAGCWTDRGIAGCLFQHAYWQGVREGVFRDEGRPGDWIGSFDRLAKRDHADRTQRRILPDKVEIRTDEWRHVVGRMLVEALSDSRAAAPARNPVPA